jgi:hypothetical protein
MKFIHPELGKEVNAPAGYYVPTEENILEYNGKKIVYVVGSNFIETSCCGKSNWTYIQIPGFIADKNLKTDLKALPFLEVEHIQDAAAGQYYQVITRKISLCPL